MAAQLGPQQPHIGPGFVEQRGQRCSLAGNRPIRFRIPPVEGYHCGHHVSEFPEHHQFLGGPLCLWQGGYPIGSSEQGFGGVQDIRHGARLRLLGQRYVVLCPELLDYGVEYRASCEADNGVDDSADAEDFDDHGFNAFGSMEGYLAYNQRVTNCQIVGPARPVMMARQNPTAEGS